MRILLLALALPVPALACEPAEFATPFAAAYFAGEPFAPATVPANMAEGTCQQDALVALLTARLGPVVGYKAAATSPGAQQQLGLTEPLLGVLTRDMLKADGATIRIDDGARLVVELDLLARVGPDGVGNVTDHVSALAAIDAFIPYVEVADLLLADGVRPSGPLLQAINAGARFGVTGVPVARGDMTPEDIEVVTGTLRRGDEVLVEAPATSLLGHPLDALLWIVNDAKTRGIAIRPGDVLSLGSMGRFVPATPGAYDARYAGLGLEDATVALTLE